MDSFYDRVLILEDDVVSDDALKRNVLAQNIDRVDVINSGLTAIQRLNDEPHPGVIFCDLKLDDMDGLQFVRFLAETGYDGDLVFVSSVDERVLSIVKQLARSLGFNVLGSIKKPVTPNQIVRLLMERPVNEDRHLPRSIVSLSAGEIITGMRNDALLPYYQPKVDVKSNRVVGFESLARWRFRGSEQILSPAAFIPAAEKLGLIDELTIHFLRHVLKDVGALRQVAPDASVAVNFSVDTLVQRDLPEMLLDMLNEFRVEPGAIVIEVTESKLASDKVNVLEVLARLHLAGFKLSIDDFGTGYSSLYRLKNTPFVELKLDRSFVRDAITDRSAQAVIRSSMRLAQELDMAVIAEGVETAEEKSLMQSMGCEVMQGYFFSHPKSLGDTINAVQANQYVQPESRRIDGARA